MWIDDIVNGVVPLATRKQVYHAAHKICNAAAKDTVDDTQAGQASRQLLRATAQVFYARFEKAREDELIERRENAES